MYERIDKKMNHEYTLPRESFVELMVYDILGKKVATIENDMKQAGKHHIEFDSSELQSGTYVYKLSTADFCDVKKMMVLKWERLRLRRR